MGKGDQVLRRRQELKVGNPPRSPRGRPRQPPAQRGRNLAGTVDEKLRRRADGAIFQGDDRDVERPRWKLSRQFSEGEAAGVEMQKPVAEMSNKTPAFRQLEQQMCRGGRHSDAWRRQAAGAKSVSNKRPDCGTRNAPRSLTSSLSVIWRRRAHGLFIPTTTRKRS
jgi:hypothetical protein